MNNPTYSPITHNPVGVRYTAAMKLNKYLQPDVPGYDYVGFGKALRWYRDRSGLTQTELAEKSGLIHAGKQVGGRISNYENRPHAPNRDYDLMRLADALGVEPDILVAGLIPKPETTAAEIEAEVMQLAREVYPDSSPEEALDLFHEIMRTSGIGRTKIRSFVRFVKLEEEGIEPQPQRPAPRHLHNGTKDGGKGSNGSTDNGGQAMGE